MANNEQRQSWPEHPIQAQLDDLKDTVDHLVTSRDEDLQAEHSQATEAARLEELVERLERRMDNTAVARTRLQPTRSEGFTGAQFEALRQVLIRDYGEDEKGATDTAHEIVTEVLGLQYEWAEKESERKYACYRCGKLRTKDEGGTVFSVCDDCWDNPNREGDKADAGD